MKNESFRDLVNLYLDGELSAKEESRLAQLLASDEKQREKFREACRLHGAAQMALDPQLLQPEDLSMRYFWSRLFMGFAAASCAVLGAMFLMPCMIDDEAAHISVPLSSKDPLLNTSFIERVVHQQHIAEESEKGTSCLAAHLRLQGLEPRLAPKGRPLLVVDSKLYATEQVLCLNEINLERQAARLVAGDARIDKVDAATVEPELEILKSGLKPRQKQIFTGTLVSY
jgi:hypothetical protein